MGRPSKYKPEFAEQAVKLCQLGATDPELANFFGVGTSTLDSWRALFPEFNEALKVGKASADDRVERSLYQRANGYSHPDVQIFCNKDGVVTKVECVKNYAPDTVACIFWLKNRRKDEWRDVKAVDANLSGSVGQYAAQPIPVEQRHSDALARPNGSAANSHST